MQAELHDDAISSAPPGSPVPPVPAPSGGSGSAQVDAPKRGRLKIFLGAAPGVGKTFAMLETAHERRREGADVVVGVVETHGRGEAQALADSLETLPHRAIEHGGQTFEELDLDAVLARRPTIVLVDELAHTNAPGSRHVERWQDVDEILAAGIDVYTTLNVQHLESLNDVVERIVGVRVRETLPDSVLHRADDIEVVDLSPEDLLKRLAEGKVYVSEQARRAMRDFFSRGNLTALRELALRQAAERVDAQMLDYMRDHAVGGPWRTPVPPRPVFPKEAAAPPSPPRDRLLVCCDEHASTPRLVRSAKRIADRLGAPWIAVHVETDRRHRLSEEAKDRISEALRLAEELGGETRVLRGDDVAGEVLALARDSNVTHVLVGRRRAGRRGRGSRWPGSHVFGRRSAGEEILRRAGGVDVLVLGSDDEHLEPHVWDRGAPRRRTPWRGVVLGVLGVAAVSGAGWLVAGWLPLPNIAVGYLLVVLVVAIELGFRPAIAASIASFLAFNFLFTEPRLSLRVEDVRNSVTLLFFLLAAFITSNLAARLRRQMEESRLGARRTQTLYEFSSRAAGAATLDDVLWAVAHHIAAAMHGQSLVLLPEGGTLQVRAGYPPEDEVDEADRAAADWAWTRNVPTGRGTTTLPTASWLFLPMRTARGAIGVLGVRSHGVGTALTSDQSRLLEALAGQAALAIERTSLVSDVEQAKLAAETDRLRAALLSSLSEELRTPVVSIRETADRLIHADENRLDATTRRELALGVEDEAERLDHFIQNLLDMTRLETGTLRPRTSAVDLRELVDAALDRAARVLGRRRVCIDLDTDLPPLQLDRALMEQVLFNLIDNASKYSPGDSRISIWARRRGARVLLEVSDEGPGIPAEDREQVFDIFYRVDSTTGSPATGLGLATARGIVEAHGGKIRVDSGLNDVGAAICIDLPVSRAEGGREAAADASVRTDQRATEDPER